MKKNRIFYECEFRCLIKTFRIMRITVFLLLVTFLQTFASNSYSQKTKLSLSISNTKLVDALDQIEDLSEFYFLYNEKLVDTKRPVNISVQNEKIDLILDRLFEGTDIKYTITDRKIILAPSFLSDDQKQITISGKVTDNNGQALPGVTVVIKGTSKGTVTDTDGKYSLTKVPEDASILFSFVGMATQEVAISGKTNIDVTLIDESYGIEEVVAIGYGTIKRRDVIGSVATVKSQDLVEVPTSAFSDILQGRAAGVQVNTTSGSPGAAVNVKVRGYHSISSGSNPLWIIDGMPVLANGSIGRNTGTAGQSVLATLNPNDIESVEVLKDAAATAIYGSRGSNGVILITTKTAKANDRGSIVVDVSTGISHLAKTPDQMNFVNTDEWFQIADMAVQNSEQDPTRTVDLDWILSPSRYKTRLTREEAENTNTNWFDYVLRTGTYQDINVSVKQGYKNGAIYASVGYRNDKSVSVGNDMERITSRINAEFNPLENLKWTSRLNFSFTDNYRVKSSSHRTMGLSDGTYGGFGMASRWGVPFLPVYDENDPTGYWNPGAGNFAATLDRNYILDNKKNYRGIGGTTLEYSLPWIKGLSIKGGADFDILQDNENIWTSSLISNDGISTDYTGLITYTSVNYNTYLNYNRTFGGKHNVTAVMGSESQRTKMKYTDMDGRSLVGNNQEMGSSSPATMVTMTSYTANERYIRSYFARANYKYMDRYLLGLSARRDGSSVFDEDYRWGNFYALSLGWIISDEDFFSSMSNTFSLLKLRGSFGQTGNQSIPNDRNLITINYDSDLRYGVNTVSPAGVSYSVGNKAITWETTDSYDVGIDFGLFKDRISGSLAYYMQDVTGLLLGVSTPPSAAIGSVLGNVGSLKNWGYEFNVSSTNIQNGNFSWVTDFNISFNKNEITSLTEAMEAAHGSTTYVGGGLGLYQKCDYAGIDPERGVHMIWEYDQDIYNETGDYVRTGRKIAYNYTNSRVYANNVIWKDKSSIPKYYGGFNNTFRYKGFEINAFFTFSGGNYMFNYSEKESTVAGTPNKLYKKDMLYKSWKADGTDEEKQNAKYPMVATYYSPWQTVWSSSAIDPNTGRAGWWLNADLNNPTDTSAKDRYDRENRGDAGSREGLTKYLEKGDYLRLKSVKLAYNLDTRFARKLGLQAANIYVSATNLWTLTQYKGWDPEVDDDSELLPSVKMYSIGAKFTF